MIKLWQNRRTKWYKKSLLDIQNLIFFFPALGGFSFGKQCCCFQECNNIKRIKMSSIKPQSAVESLISWKIRLFSAQKHYRLQDKLSNISSTTENDVLTLPSTCVEHKGFLAGHWKTVSGSDILNEHFQEPFFVCEMFEYLFFGVFPEPCQYHFCLGLCWNLVRFLKSSLKL